MQVALFGEVHVYWDPLMEPNEVLVGYKGKSSDVGLVWVPNQNFVNVKPAPIEKSEVDRTLKKIQKSRKWEDVGFIITGKRDFSERDYETIKNEFKTKRETN